MSGVRFSIFRRSSCLGSWGGFVRVSCSAFQVGWVNKFGGFVLRAAFEQGLNMRFIGSVLSAFIWLCCRVQVAAPCRFFGLVQAPLPLRKARCLGSSAACYNKAPKSDKVKLSHPLLAQGLRQLHFAPWQRRYVSRRSCEKFDRAI
jgi:hypothetical protein